MKRLKRIAALVLLILAFLLPAGVAQANHADFPCSFHWWKGVWHRTELIKCEFERIEPPGTFRYVRGLAVCESGPDMMDTYWEDGYAGPYQQATRYWDPRFDSYQSKWDRELVDKAINFRSNTIISFRMAKSKGTWQQDWACA